MTKRVSIIIPFLNEEDNLPVLYDRLATMAGTHAEVFEFIFVDDGSSDGSADWVLRQSRKDPRLKMIRLSRNFGHQVAITAGLDVVSGDAAVIMDADLQDPPEVVSAMLARWREGYDLVSAQRVAREGEPLSKKLLAALFYRVFRSATSIKVPVDTGDFRLMDRKVIDAMKQMRETHRYMRAMSIWVGFRQALVTYERQARYAGQTKYPVWKSMKLAWDGLTSFSGAPLRWMSALGFGIGLLGLLWIFQIIFDKIMHPERLVQGWGSMIAVILFLGGVQLISIGFVGQYVSRIFEETKKRPLYFIKEWVGDFSSCTEGESRH